MAPIIKNLSELCSRDTAIAGGKGASLGEMINNGIPVPPGFVVLSTTFEKFIEETELVVEIDSILHTVNHREMHTVENASEKIQALILNAKMPDDIAVEILKFHKILDAKFVAVRSSATAEDSSQAAWAGQLDTYLNTVRENLLEKVKRCWASLFTPRAIFYRFEKGLHKDKISVAVVVQKMIESEVSGIAFSVHPVTQDRNQIIIEAGLGLGEAIVSGEITPDSYVVEKEPRNILEKIFQYSSGVFIVPRKGATSGVPSVKQPVGSRHFPKGKYINFQISSFRLKSITAFRLILSGPRKKTGFISSSAGLLPPWDRLHQRKIRRTRVILSKNYNSKIPRGPIKVFMRFCIRFFRWETSPGRA